MPDHIYKTVDLVGTSAKGPQEAIENAIARASGTLRNIRWFEVSQLRGSVDANKISHWQVSMKVGFTLDE